MPPYSAAAGPPIDLDHLRAVTLGDPALEREVLLLFLEQTAALMRRLASLPADAAALAHTMKGSARAIGAFGVADAATALEAALGDEAGARAAVRRLDAEAGRARRAATARLRR
ncbi:MAG: Hpt domain-containing protein [Xanthobacteraceae bacterium]|nr:Hpt domain-containing protein [Xanthobacteraceae bacterium]